MNTAARRLPATLAVQAAAMLASAPFTAQAADMNAVNHAASIASGVGAGTAAPSLGVGAVLQTLVGLAVVVALVFACAWLARRFGLQPGARGGLVRTIGGVSLGGKERVAVVEVGDTWLVLGAAPGNVRLLHTLPAGSTGHSGSSHGGPGQSSDPDASALPPGTFGTRFRAALAGEAKKRFSRPSGGGK
ncbi:flagellar biosynthetic protein FliO [Trinickia fusca]|uniref:Flagellar protein n=1 Tax=Trinickia fusca TaxID=2419777 RepID=A0A494X1Z9_9BURK|nr:flagellar biosynthetic protein FliO [Trinickia fusca]RKP44382.1 flagellar biosynthetic protein FliO [Trinickia fusca]